MLVSFLIIKIKTPCLYVYNYLCITCMDFYYEKYTCKYMYFFYKKYTLRNYKVVVCVLRIAKIVNF